MTQIIASWYQNMMSQGDLMNIASMLTKFGRDEVQMCSTFCHLEIFKKTQSDKVKPLWGQYFIGLFAFLEPVVNPSLFWWCNKAYTSHVWESAKAWQYATLRWIQLMPKCFWSFIWKFENIHVTFYCLLFLFFVSGFWSWLTFFLIK